MNDPNTAAMPLGFQITERVFVEVLHMGRRGFKNYTLRPSNLSNPQPPDPMITPPGL